MRNKRRAWIAIVVAALVLEGWALYVVSLSARQWRPALIVKDEPVAHAMYEAMIEALRQAERLSYTSFCSGQESGRTSFYQISQQKPDRFHIQVANGPSSKCTTIVGDGDHLWTFWAGDRPYLRIDDDQSYEEAASDVYIQRPATAERSDAGREIARLGEAWYGLILDPEIFHGHADRFEPTIDGIRARGRNDVGGEVCDVIEVSYMQAQRTRVFWLSREDHLPRRIKEIVRLADVHVTIEEWRDLAINADIPPKTFAWSPPEGWRPWTPPTAERFLLAADREAPDFTLPSADKGTISLSDYRGQVVWLCMWQVGSPACRQQMRHLQSLYAEYGDKGLVILGLNFTDDRCIARAFLKANGATSPTVLDASQIAERVVWGGYGNKPLDVPLSYVIDRDGKVVDAWYGYEEGSERGLDALGRAGRPVESHPAR